MEKYGDEKSKSIRTGINHQGIWSDKQYLEGGAGRELLNLPQCDIQDQAEGEKAPGALPTPADELATGHNVYEATVLAEMSYLRYDIIQRELIRML